MYKQILGVQHEKKELEEKLKTAEGLLFDNNLTYPQAQRVGSPNLMKDGSTKTNNNTLGQNMLNYSMPNPYGGSNNNNLLMLNNTTNKQVNTNSTSLLINNSIQQLTSLPSASSSNNNSNIMNLNNLNVKSSGLTGLNSTTSANSGLTGANSNSSPTTVTYLRELQKEYGLLQAKVSEQRVEHLKELSEKDEEISKWRTEALENQFRSRRLEHELREMESRMAMKSNKEEKIKQKQRAEERSKAKSRHSSSMQESQLITGSKTQGRGSAAGPGSSSGEEGTETSALTAAERRGEKRFLCRFFIQKNPKNPKKTKKKPKKT